MLDLHEIDSGHQVEGRFAPCPPMTLYVSTPRSRRVANGLLCRLALFKGRSCACKVDALSL